MQAITTAPFGGPTAPIWAYRIPSILSALASVLLLAWFGTRAAQPAVGLAAAAIFLASVNFTLEMHIAKIDTTLLLSVLIAQVALYLSIEPRPAGERPKFAGWPLVLWIAIGAGLLLKGPIILAVVGLTLLGDAALGRERRVDQGSSGNRLGSFLAGTFSAAGARLRALRPLIGFLIPVAMVLPWLIAIDIKTHGEFLNVAIGKSIGGKLAGTSDRHAGAPGYHTLLFMVTFFPSVVLAGLGAAQAYANRGERLTRFLIAWAVPTWILFELVPTKLPHYVLPVFPALALLVALGIRGASTLLTKNWAVWCHRVAGILFVVAALVLGALPFVAASFLGASIGLPEYVAAGGVVAVLLAGLSLWLKPSTDRLVPFVASMFLVYLAMLQFVIPSLDPLWASDRIARRLETMSGCAPIKVATAGFAEPSILFHFGPATLLGSGATAADFLTQHTSCGVAIVESSQRATFDAQASAKGLSLLSLGKVAGFNYVKGKRISLEILLPSGTTLRAQR